MRKATALLVTSVILMQPLSSQIYADATDSDMDIMSTESTPTSEQQTTAPATPKEQPAPTKPVPAPPKAPQQLSTAPFKAFTGKITKNKVRVRLQPNLDGPILRELAKDDMIVVLGETDDFYAIKPPKDAKAYVFRTFILDNVVEGTHVNVRLEPDLDAPIVAQLNQGDRISGTLSPLNSKWLEIAMPENARFFISKDYIEKVGDPSVMSTHERRRDEVNSLLNDSYTASQTELQKPYEQINIDQLVGNLKKIINNYSDFADQASRAKEILAKVQDTYIQKKIAYLENKAKTAANTVAAVDAPANAQSPANTYSVSPKFDESDDGDDTGMNSKMAQWESAEKAIYDSWAEENNHMSQDTFYEEQAKDAVTLKGILEPYHRNVKNRPGDYVLINPATKLPIAYLYSTKVNLQRKVGQAVTVQGLPRPHNNFAFPAYFAITVE